MPAKILPFVSRSEQLRLRGQRNFSHWHRITKGLEPFGPAEQKRLSQRQAEDEAKDRAWAQRHGRVNGGAIVVAFQLSPSSAHTQPTPITQRGSR